MANRYQEDLKRIVGVSDRAGGIDAQGEKKAIPGGRGIVYFNRGGDSQTASGTPGVTTQPGGDLSGGGTDGGQAGGSTSAGGSNGGNTTGTEGISAPYPIDAASGLYNSTDLRLGDLVKGLLDLKDCETGDIVQVRFDGQYSGNAPEVPDQYGWDVYYLRTQGDVGPGFAYTPDAACPVGYVGGGSGICCGEFCDPGGTEYAQYNIGEGPRSDVSQASPYVEYDESVVQLTLNPDTGQFEANPLQKVPAKYSQPVSSFELCNQAGEPVKSYTIADGGHAFYNSTTGIAVFKDKAGKITGYGDAQAITNRLPR